MTSWRKPGQLGSDNHRWTQMNTDKRGPDLQAAKNTGCLLKEETHNIIGCAFEVLNELGHGLKKPSVFICG